MLCPQLKNPWLYAATVFQLLPKNRVYTYEYKNGMHISFRAGTHDTQIHVEIFGNGIYMRQIAGDIMKMRRVIDLGAQTGVFTLSILSKNKNIRVVSVEATSDNASLAKRNMEQNGLSGHVSVLHRAAWGKSGERILMNLSNCNSGRHSAVRSGHGYTDGEYAETISLRDVVGGEEVDLLKLDIEGSEYEVLNSADAETLSRIREIIMEVHGSREQNEALKDHLLNNGFTIKMGNGYMSAFRK